MYHYSTLNVKYWQHGYSRSWVEVYYKIDRLLPGLTAQQIGKTVRWYSNKTPLYIKVMQLCT